MSKIRVFNNKGFSLIELMVVVAIIAILATVAIPQYQLFQAKSRRNEGLSMLGAYYTSAQATFAETSQYPGNFVATGFQPAGQVHARITVVDNSMSLPIGTPSEAGCINTTAAVCTGTTGYKTWFEVITGNWIATTPGTAMAATSAGVGGTFTAVSSSMIRVGGMNNDEWTVNQVKAFANPLNGLL